VYGYFLKIQKTNSDVFTRASRPSFSFNSCSHSSVKCFSESFSTDDQLNLKFYKITDNKERYKCKQLATILVLAGAAKLLEHVHICCNPASVVFKVTIMILCQ